MTPNLRLKSPRRLLRCTLALGAAEPQSGVSRASSKQRGG